MGEYTVYIHSISSPTNSVTCPCDRLTTQTAVGLAQDEAESVQEVGRARPSFQWIDPWKRAVYTSKDHKDPPPHLWLKEFRHQRRAVGTVLRVFDSLWGLSLVLRPQQGQVAPLPADGLLGLSSLLPSAFSAWTRWFATRRGEASVPGCLAALCCETKRQERFGQMGLQRQEAEPCLPLTFVRHFQEQQPRSR